MYHSLNVFLLHRLLSLNAGRNRSRKLLDVYAQPHGYAARQERVGGAGAKRYRAADWTHASDPQKRLTRSFTHRVRTVLLWLIDRPLNCFSFWKDNRHYIDSKILDIFTEEDGSTQTSFEGTREFQQRTFPRYIIFRTHPKL